MGYVIYIGSQDGASWNLLRRHDGCMMHIDDKIWAVVIAAAISDLPEYHKHQFKVMDLHGNMIEQHCERLSY